MASSSALKPTPQLKIILVMFTRHDVASNISHMEEAL